MTSRESHAAAKPGIGSKPAFRGRLSQLAFAAMAFLLLAWPATGKAACFDIESAIRPQPSTLERWRASWADRGISVGGSYTGEVFANIAGGLDETATYDGLLDLFVTADLDRLAGWRGLCFHAEGFQIHGESITAEGTGSLAPASSIEADPATRLSEIWLQQNLLQGHASIRFGQLAADKEFILSGEAAHFLNATWGWPTIAAFDTPQGGPAYPMAAPGVRLALHPNERLDFRFAIFNGRVAEPCSEEDPQLCNLHGVAFPLDDPPLMLGEMAARYHLANRLPGELKLGGWYHFDEFEEMHFNAGGRSIVVTRFAGALLGNNYGLYAIVNQKIWQPHDAQNDAGISLFGRVMGAPESSNLVDFYADVGVIVKGMVAARPDDVLALGFAYTDVSDSVGAFEVETGAMIARSYESLAEMTYTLSLRDTWKIQTGLEYIWHPGGGYSLPPSDRALDNALVIGTRSIWTF
ncbi:MAG: carbohydrate porin [Methyloligella sp. ZOD6]